MRRRTNGDGMNFEVLLQNRTYICCNILSCLPKFTDLFACMCFFPIQTTWCSRGGFRGGPKGPRPPPSPFCDLLNISALHFQYGIQASAKFKRPECAKLHLRELQSQTFSRRSMCPKLPPTLPLYFISLRPLYHKILRPPLFNPGLSQFLSKVFLP